MTLRGNRSGTVTLPSPHQYPHQWSWDSAFIAIGLAHFDPAAARTELTALFDGQWPTGRLPHIVFNPQAGAADYFPGPDFWHSTAMPTLPRRTSGIVQPPVHARAVLAVHRADPTGSAAFLRDMYPKLLAWHRYLTRSRNVGRSGLAAIVHPWESGLDNSPLWDEAVAGAGALDPGQFTRRDRNHVGSGQRPTDADYRAYVGLATHYRTLGYDDTALADHPFVVEDPLFNALLLDAELCLASIAELLGEDPEPRTESGRRLHHALLERLWDPARAAFSALDVRTGIRSAADTISGLVPLLDPWLPDGTRQRLLDRLDSADFLGGCAFPLPSTATGSPAFDRHRYWRGPTWINTNWLVWLAAGAAGRPDLADRIARSSLQLVATQGFREYYDPFDGSGLGARDFSWTAALTLDWLAAGAVPTDPATT